MLAAGLLAAMPDVAGVSAEQLCSGDVCLRRWCDTDPACGAMQTCMLLQSYSCETDEPTGDPVCAAFNVWNMCAASCDALDPLDYAASGSEDCTNGEDDDCDGVPDDRCAPEKTPYAGEEGDEEECFETAGDDPIMLATKAVVTAPYTDFAAESVVRLSFTRTYSSSDGRVSW